MALNQINLKFSKILLDPNNPRFAKREEEEVPIKRIHEDEVQKDTLNKMSVFDIKDIKDSMIKNGFLPYDNIFVQKLDDHDLYVCREGNRRVTSITQILNEHSKGQLTIDDAIIKTLENVPVTDISDLSIKDIDTLLGLRHIGGIKPWDILPSAYNLYKKYMEIFCEETGFDNEAENFAYEPRFAKKVKESFSTKLPYVRDNVRSYRTYYQILKEAEERGAEFPQDKYSIIVVAAGTPKLRNEYELDENSATLSDHGLDKFFDNVIGDSEKEPVIKQATAGNSNMRDFGYILTNGIDRDRDRVIEDRVEASIVKADIIARKQQRDLLDSLKEVAKILQALQLGEIHELSESEKEYVTVCEEVLYKLKRAGDL